MDAITCKLGGGKCGKNRRLGAENVALGGGKCAKIFVTHCVTVWFFPKKDF